MSPVTETLRRHWRPLLIGALVVLLVVRLLSSAAGGDDPPADRATRLVPASALVYVHLSTDGDRDATKRARRLAARFPGFARIRDNVVKRLGAPGCDAGIKDVEGAEMALALLDSPGETAGSLVLVDTGEDGGEDKARPCGGLQVQRIGRFAAIGQASSLQTARELEAGRGASLADDPTYKRATGALPADRVADAWASADGVRRLLTPQGGLLGAAGVLLDQPALRGTALAVTAEDRRVRVTVRSELQPGGRGRTPFRPFEPSLAGTAPANALGYLGVSGLSGALQRVLAAAGSQSGGIGTLLGQLGRRLSREGAAGPLRRLTDLFRGESAIVLTPSLPAPTLSVVARTDDEAGTGRALEQLQPALEKALSIRGAPAPAFRRRGDAFQLRLAQGLELDYAVLEGKVIVSTELQGIEALRGDGDRLPGTSAFKETAGARLPREVTSLVFLNFSQLLRLAEQTGLNDSRAYLAVKDDLQKVRAVGAHSRAGKDESTAELLLSIP